MKDLGHRFFEDRAMRDAARANLFADIEHIKLSLSGKSISGRFVDRISDGAKDVLEQASETAEDNRGVLAALLGAFILWLSREPLLAFLGFEIEDDNDEEQNIEQTEANTAKLSPHPSGEDDD